MPNDPLWMQGFLAVHIAAGSLCLVLAPLVLAVTKGGARHKRWGKIYLWSMAAVAVTAVTMGIFRPVLLLAFLGVLSFYLAFSGYRITRLKGLANGGRAKAIDWLAAMLAFAACVCLTGYGLVSFNLAQPLTVVSVIFGVVGTRGTFLDMVRFVRKPTQPMFWLYLHFQKFIASYIAAWTAFSAVALSQVFPNYGLAVWLWPAFVGVPAIAAMAAYYKRKFALAHVKETRPFLKTSLDTIRAANGHQSAIRIGAPIAHRLLGGK